MLKFRQHVANSSDDNGSLPKPSDMNRKCSFISSQLGHSKATIILRNLSLPLAWPFLNSGERKEWREFTVQLVLRSNKSSSKQFSEPKEGVNRTITDVEFMEEFVFPDEDADFGIELYVLCRRISSENTGSVVRSLGRSIGHSWRKYQQKEEYQNNCASATRFASGIENNIGAPNRGFLEELRKFGIQEEKRLGSSASGVEKNSLLLSCTPKMILKDKDHHIVGLARFCLTDATSGKTHSYVLDKLTSFQNLLPIYGNISAQILVQPNSLITPLAQGTLDIFSEGILHQQMYCVLQGGQLCCWEINKMENEILDSKLHLNKTPKFCLQFNGKERLERTAFPTAFRLTLFNDHTNSVVSSKKNENQSFLCICPSHHALIGWRNALNLQRRDYTIWAEFAQIQRNHHSVTFKDFPSNDFNNLHGDKTSIPNRPLSRLNTCYQSESDKVLRNIRPTNKILSPSRISLLQAYRQNQQNQIQKNEKFTSRDVRTVPCNTNTFISLETKKEVKIRQQLAQNYILSLNINNDRIQPQQKYDENKTFDSQYLHGGSSRNRITTNNDKQQERPFNINLDSRGIINMNEQQKRMERLKVERSETWHFTNKSQACTRL